MLPEAEMRRLWDQHGMDAVISTCAVNEAPVKQDPYHSVFCCTIIVVTYSEPVTNTEVAVLHRQVRVNCTHDPTIYIMRFRVGTTVYVQKIEP